MNKAAVIAFTGQRQLPKGQNLKKLEGRLYAEIEKSIIEGYTTFLFGAALGWDQLCAKVVIQHKIQYPHIKLKAIIPFPGQENRWSGQEKSDYHALLQSCDEIIIVSQSFHKDCYRIRDQYLVDNAAKLIAYYNGR